MIAEQEMEQFWEGFGKRDREAAESDPRYHAAMEAGNYVKAQELACSFLCGAKAKRGFIEDRVLREEFGMAPNWNE